jgi:hypothetical protein
MRMQDIDRSGNWIQKEQQSAALFESVSEILGSPRISVIHPNP